MRGLGLLLAVVNTLCEFPIAALVGGFFGEDCLRLDRLGEARSNGAREYDVVYHAQRGDQLGASLRGKHGIGRVLEGDEERSAGRRDFGQTPGVRRQERIEEPADQGHRLSAGAAGAGGRGGVFQGDDFGPGVHATSYLTNSRAACATCSAVTPSMQR